MASILKFLFYLAVLAVVVLLAAGMALVSLFNHAVDTIEGASAAPASAAPAIQQTPAPSQSLGDVEAPAPVTVELPVEAPAPVTVELPQADSAPAEAASVHASAGAAAAATVVQVTDDAFAVEYASSDVAVSDVAVPQLDESHTEGPATVTVPVYVCAPEDRYGTDYLIEQANTLQAHVAPFFVRESSGALNLHFVTAEVISPSNIDWDTTTMRKQHDEVILSIRATGTGYTNPCVAEARDRNTHTSDTILVLADMASGGSAGYAYYDGPAIAITQNRHRDADLDRFLRTVAHELGHSVLRLCHPHETSRPVNDSDHSGECRIAGTVHGTHYDKDAFQTYHEDHVYDPHDESLMSHKKPDKFEHSYISCRQRYIIGFDLEGCRGAPITDPGYLASIAPPPIPVQQPGPVIGLGAESGDGRITVVWSAPVDDGGGAIIGYNVAYRPSGGAWTRWAHSGTATSATITGLSAGTEYEIEIAATNIVGNGGPEYIRATTTQPAAEPKNPAPEPKKPAPTTTQPTPPSREVHIAWGDDATGRGNNCAASANCRNLTYTLTGDFGPAPYHLECLGEGHDPWDGTWYGREDRGCYYRGTGHTIYVVIDGIRSNDLVGPPAPTSPGPQEQVRISWGSDATGRGSNCPASRNCRNLDYHVTGLGPGPYHLECYGTGHDDWDGHWSGNPGTGCFFRDTGHTVYVYVVINGVRSNDLRK